MTDEVKSPDFGRSLRRIEMVVALLRLSSQEAIEEMTGLLHPEITMLPAPGVAPVRRYETRQDFLDYFSEASANGILVQPDVSDIRVLPSGSIFVTGRLRVSGPGVADITPAWFIYSFRDGLISSLDTYLDLQMAEHAAGAES